MWDAIFCKRAAVPGCPHSHLPRRQCDPALPGESRMSTRNIGASIRDRLLNKARAEKLDYNLLLTRYALERMLFRSSISEQRDHVGGSQLRLLPPVER